MCTQGYRSFVGRFPEETVRKELDSEHCQTAAGKAPSLQCQCRYSSSAGHFQKETVPEELDSEHRLAAAGEALFQS